MIEAEIISDDNELTAELDGRGDRGPIGKTPNVQIGIVETLDAGNKAVVTRAGTDENPIFNFGIPQGEKGDIGPIGKTGPSGVYQGETEPANPDVNVWIDPNGETTKYAKKTDLDNLENKLNEKIASGELNGVGITKITNGQSEIQDDYTVTPIEVHKSDGTSSTVKVSVKNGTNGTNGKDGVGITTITSGQSSVEADKTITPVTVQKSDGSSQSFKVEAKNGQDGLTPSIGENGNWFIGDTDTGKPSRGEVGPSPDLSYYVKNTDYANTTKAGVFKPTRNLYVNPETGYVYAQPVSKEEYNSSEDTIFMAKGTTENIKDDYVGSSNPVITLNSTLDNLVRKNRVSDYIVSLKDALKYKVFEFLVHGKVKQETTTGKNLFDYTTVRSTSGLTTTINTDGSITTKGTPTESYIKLVLEKDYNDKLDDGETYTISQDVAGYIYLQIYAVPKDGGSTIYYASSNSQTRKEVSFTVNKSIYDYRATLQSGLIADVGEDINFTAKFQLEKGSTATSYEPYTGGQPSPSPDYPQPITTLTFDKITRCGKNYLNVEDGSQTINGVTVTKNNGKITVNGTATNICFFPISKSIDNFQPGKYVLSANNSKTLNNNQNLLRIMKEDNTGYLESTITNFSKINNTTIFNITADDEVNNTYLLLRIETGTVLDNFVFYPQLEQGSQATDYEPYQATEYTIDLQGNEMVELPNGVQNDLIIDKQGNVSLIKNIGKIVLDGSEDEIIVKRSDTITPSVSCFRIENFDYTLIGDLIGMCDYFIYDTELKNIKDTFRFIKSPGYAMQFCVEDNLASNSNEFRTWLSTHNVTVYYPLATPEVIPLGKLTDLITTEEGSNTFFINGNLETTLEVLYARDSEKYLQQYIDDKVASLSSAIIEEG